MKSTVRTVVFATLRAVMMGGQMELDSVSKDETLVQRQVVNENR